MTVVIDRSQREALREEIECRSSGYGDIGFAFKDGERDYVVERLEGLRRLVELLDAIGWGESAEAPERVAMSPTGALAAWARDAAAELQRAFTEFTPTDADRGALATLQALGVPSGA
ncbi:MAG: hypothetical protein ACR2HD_05505 [Solirubrobacteraceae bacterium]|nr:MAG: hypothetical protein DLM63_00040 [Solirubrobacterales bacterium]